MNITTFALYNTFAEQASAQAIADTSTHALALDIENLDTEKTIADYTAAAQAVKREANYRLMLPHTKMRVTILSIEEDKEL